MFSPHSHLHGDHEHNHSHEWEPNDQHRHGWHGKAESCGGDDTFGEEEGPRVPSGLVAPQVALLPPGPAVVRPFVAGMLHEGPGHPVNVGASQYDYYDLIVAMCERGEPFVIVEQDIVPPPGAVEALLACPEPWCGHSYDVAPREHNGRVLADVVEIFGDLGCLGLTAFKGRAVRWLGIVLSGWAPITWSKLDGMCYRALRIAEPGTYEPGQPGEGLRIHQHFPSASHLHNYAGDVAVPISHTVLGEPL